MDNQEISNAEKKSFFQTLPGILTGIAGLITAIGGFIIILNKVGCMNAKTTSREQTEEKKPMSDTLISANKSIAKNEYKDTSNSIVSTNQKSIVSYSPTEVKNFKSNLIFKIKESSVQTSGQNVLLNIKFKCFNESAYVYYFYPAYIRIKSGEDKYGPDESSPSIDRQQINSQGFTDLEYNFIIPKEITEFQLLLFDSYSFADPITFKIK